MPPGEHQHPNPHHYHHHHHHHIYHPGIFTDSRSQRQRRCGRMWKQGSSQPTYRIQASWGSLISVRYHQYQYSYQWDKINISLKLRTLFRWGEGKAVEWSSGPSDKVNFTIPSQHLDCWMKKLKILSFLRDHFLEHIFKIPLRIWSRGEREGQVWVDPAALRLHARYRAPNRYVCVRACNTHA